MCQSDILIFCFQSGLTLLPATAGIRQPVSVTLGESNSMATTGRPNGMILTSQTTPLLPKVTRGIFFGLFFY